MILKLKNFLFPFILVPPRRAPMAWLGFICSDSSKGEIKYFKTFPENKKQRRVYSKISFHPTDELIKKKMLERQNYFSGSIQIEIFLIKITHSGPVCFSRHNKSKLLRNFKLNSKSPQVKRIRDLALLLSDLFFYKKDWKNIYWKMFGQFKWTFLFDDITNQGS